MRNYISKLLIISSIITSALVISLSAASATSINTFQSEVQNIRLTSQIAYVNREQQGDSLLIIDPITHTQKLVAQFPDARIVGIPVWSLDCKIILVDQIDKNNNKIHHTY